LPTETQKNTCYANALLNEFDCVEDYGLALGRDILKRHKHIDAVRLELEERLWERVTVSDGGAHNHAFFAHRDPIKRTASIAMSRNAFSVTAGVADIKLMKTTQSGFKGFIEDKYTNLKPVGEGTASPDRIMCTLLDGTWTYTRRPSRGFSATNAQVLQVLLNQFAGPAKTGKFSLSLQDTTYRMCTAALNTVPELSEVHLKTPNVHFYTYPLETFGLSNPNIVFQSTDPASTASGRIVTTVRRPKSSL
jgi:urate oxidase